MTSVSTGEAEKRREEKGEREEEEEEERNSVVTTCSNYTLKCDNQKVPRSVYVWGRKLSFRISKNLWEDFQERARLDGLSASKLSEKALIEYFEHHPLPNPQSRIDRMLEVEMPHKPVTECCVEGCKNKPRFLLRLKDYTGKSEEFLVCNQHRRWRHKRFMYLVSYRELP